MNLTLDQYLSGLERSAREIPRVLAEWATLDYDLCDSYAEQLAWLLQVQADIFVSARSLGRDMEVAERLARANAEFLALQAQIGALLGVDVPRLLHSADIKTPSGTLAHACGPCSLAA